MEWKAAGAEAEEEEALQEAGEPAAW